MDYPREINLDEETKQALINYLETEIQNHEAERGLVIEDLKRWQRDYFVKPSQEKRTFPFVGASNIIVPLTAITVEAVHARNMMTLFGLPQFVSCKLMPAADDLSHALEQYLDYELIKEVDIYKTMDNVVLEIEKFGTGIIKTGWDKQVRTAVRTVGNKEEEFEVTIKQGPTAKPCPRANFLMPFTNQDAQTSGWVGEAHSKTLNEIHNMEQSGIFKKGTYAAIKNFYLTSAQNGADDYRQSIEKLTGETPTYPKLIEWYEIWMSFDVDKSKKLKEIVLHYHRQTRTFMSIRYNWYEDLHRPYRKANYFTLEHRWDGIGIGKQQEQFQKEITIQHRQRLDSGTIANARMIKVRKMSGFGPGEPFFPGKIWMVDDMADVESFQLGDLPTSAFSNENSTLLFAQQRSGINELNLGMPQAGTPGTATSDLARVQEGSRKFDYTYRNIKRLSDEVTIDVTCNIAQFGPSNSRYFDMYPQGQEIKAFLSAPIQDLRSQLLGSISTAGAQQNKMLDRQNWTQVSQMLTSYYSQLFPLIQQTGDPKLIQAAMMSIMTGSNEAMKQLLESFDIRNIDRILIQLNQARTTPQVPVMPPPSQLGAGNGITEPPVG